MMCKDCIHFSVCKFADEEVCKGTKVKDLEHDCKDYRESISRYKDEVERLFHLTFSDWWFGTRGEYNVLSEQDKNKYKLFFVDDKGEADLYGIR